MADGDLAVLSALFPEPQNPLGPLVLEISTPQPGDGANPGPGVGQGPPNSAISEADYMGGVDRAEQVAGLLDGQAGSLSISGVVFPALDRLEGVEWRGMPGHQGVEEVPQGSQGLVLGCAVAGELVDETAGQAWRNPGEIEGLRLSPSGEAIHHTAVGAAGVGIGDPGAEELIGGKEGLRAGVLEDGRDRSGRIKGLRGG